MHCLAHEFLVLWLVMLLSLAICQDTCRVQDGKPGEPGIPGRDGHSGQKGQKGEAAPWLDVDMKIGVKGDGGDRGFPGSMGPKGYRGENGQQGLPGPQGRPGPRGDSSGLDGQHQSAFSVERTVKDKPNNGAPVTFNTVLADINGDFNLKTGYFTCKIAGVYYFVFHSMSSMGNLCLALKSDALGQESLGFCDFNKKGIAQVLSGGGVLKLTQGQKVWVEPFKEGSKLANHMTETQSRSIVFNGFLIFPAAE